MRIVDFELLQIVQGRFSGPALEEGENYRNDRLHVGADQLGDS